MNCFFVSCEIAENPDLEGKVVAVGGTHHSRKGIILAANYEARKYGVHAAMKISDALIKCPHLIIVDPNMQLYGEYSQKFFEYFLSITPLVEPGSIDEGYLDITDVCKPEEAINLAHKIQKTLLEEYRLPCSIGIGPNKFLAKMASDMKKPLGITVLRKREIAEKMWPLPIEDMIGVGKKTKESLYALGIKTIGDLANYHNLELLKKTIGEANANSLYNHAHGIGSNIVDTNQFTDISSVSNSQTFEKDLYDTNEILMNLKIINNSVSHRLEKKELKAYTITMQLKYNNFVVVTRSRTLDKPTNNSKEMFRVIQELFEDHYDDNYGIRLVGVGASKLVEAKEVVEQMNIFDDFETADKEQKINRIIGQINKDIGEKSLVRGIKLDDEKKKDPSSKFDKYSKRG